jgi:hypothetical protein
MPVEVSDAHRLARAFLVGLCTVNKVRRVPRLYTSRWPKSFGNDMGMYVFDNSAIYINLRVHDTIDEVYDTLLHEYCHYVTRTESKDHGPRWKAAAKKCGISATQ